MAPLQSEPGSAPSSWLLDVLDRFEEAWQRGERPDPSAFLPRDGDREKALAALLNVDMERRWQAGETIRIESYLERHPELTERGELVLNLIAAEYRLRKIREPHLGWREYRDRFPHFSAAIERCLESAPAESARPDAPVSAVDNADTELPGANQGPDPAAYSFLEPAQATDELGRLGAYRVLGVLGSGGMGLVFRAEEMALGRRLALKTMKPSVAANPNARQRFFREARAMAAIDHDHIVPILQVGEANGVPFLAMPLLQGETLEKHCRRHGALPVADVLRIGRQVAAGLAAAHSHGLIHRDIKPANLWLEQRPDDSRRIKILDFGLARLAMDEIRLTQSGEVLGTPAYMAPEQARDAKGVDHRCDLFSLGCVLYRLSTGRLPFQAPTTIALLRALAHEQPPPPHEVNPQVPEALSHVIMHLLRKKPAERPPAADDVVQVLHDLEKDPASWFAPQPATESIPARGSRAARPARAWAWIAAAFSCMVVAVVVTLSMMSGKQAARTIASESARKSQPGTVPASITARPLPASDQEVAKRVLDLGGTVSLRMPEGNIVPVTNLGDLPAAKFAIQAINLANKKQVADADMEQIGALERIEWLSLHGTSITDAGLGRLERKTTLSGLWIGQTRVTSKGMAVVQSLSGLADLHLGGLPITDADLQALAGLTGMWRLYLEYMPVTDAGLVHLQKMKRLQHLSLDGTSVTGPGLEHLWRPESFRLDMKNSHITDAGLAYLKGFPALFELHLSGTQVSDAGLIHLEGLKNLGLLSLDGTRVSAAGVKKLKAVLPNCGIAWTEK